MKKILLSLLAVGLLAFAGYSQPVTINTNTSPPTLSGPAVTGFNWLLTVTNIMPAAYGIYTDHGYGFGVEALYNIVPASTNTFGVASGFGFDCVFDKSTHHDNITMPSIQAQLQAPLFVAGKITTVLFGVTGVATPIGGEQSNNGNVSGIFGAGLAAVVAGKIDTSHLDLFYAYEYRTTESSGWHLFGLAYRF